ncbi:hypothetical protein NGRA_3357 [Nosema granulosis]|uniref:Uncharacterized protein n=1 Tax=Nosema granulosis TaxID=83296 RepID=A0A9P6KWU6_9MICR|nr:hypothetical protein NGRA_3357 [Nosema granulosis]
MASADITLRQDVNQSPNNFLTALENVEYEHIHRRNRRTAVNQPKYRKGKLHRLLARKKEKHSIKQKHPHVEEAKNYYNTSKRDLKRVQNARKTVMKLKLPLLTNPIQNHFSVLIRAK